MLTCPNCGYDNELGRLFCHSCGKKLDLAQIKPPSQGGPRFRRKGALTPAKIVRRVIDVVILVVLVWVVYLLLATPEVPTPTVTEEVIRSMDRKQQALQEAAFGSKQRTITVTEAELNAYLATLKHGKADGTGLKFIPDKLLVDLEPGRVMVVVQGKLQITSTVGKELVFRCTGVPAIENGFKFNRTGGWIGKLPVHPKLLDLTGLFDRYFGTLFSQLRHEKELLDRAQRLVIEKDAATIQYEPGNK